MKSKTYLLLCRCFWISGMLTASGCRHIDAPDYRENAPLQLSADIAQEKQQWSRADVSASYDRNAFQNGDIIKVERDDSELTPASCTYIYSGTGWAWTQNSTETDGPFYAYENGKAFTATFPTDYSAILEDQTGEGFLKSNKLTATATVTAGALSFTFVPAFTKVTFVVYYQTAEAVPGDALIVKAANLRGGTTNADESVKSLCKTIGTATEHTYSAIINPGTYALNITLGSITYTATSKVFAAATHYTYTLYRKGDRFQSGAVTITGYATGTSAGEDISAT